MKIDGKIEYVYNNGYIFIYKTSLGLTVYDLNKIIPIRFAGLLASDMNKKLKTYFELNYGNYSYYDTITLIGAESDTSGITYPVNDYMQYLMSLYNLSEENPTNIFHLNITSNIDIYGTTKSFDIYKKLLTGTLKHNEIINNIFKITGDIGRNNTMYTLMEHMYEYTRTIALKEYGTNIHKNIHKKEHISVISMYIGYTLIVLVLKYYSNVLKMNTSKHLDRNILDTFNKNFPVFKDFMDKSIDIMIGHKI
jgi:hypothetical protein